MNAFPSSMYGNWSGMGAPSASSNPSSSGPVLPEASPQFAPHPLQVGSASAIDFAPQMDMNRFNSHRERSADLVSLVDETLTPTFYPSVTEVHPNLPPLPPTSIECILRNIDPADLTMELLTNFFKHLYLFHYEQQSSTFYDGNRLFAEHDHSMDFSSSLSSPSLEATAAAAVGNVLPPDVFPSTGPILTSPLSSSSTSPASLSPSSAQNSKANEPLGSPFARESVPAHPFCLYDYHSANSTWSPPPSSVCQDSDDSSNDDRLNVRLTYGGEGGSEEDDDYGTAGRETMEVEFPRRQNKDSCSAASSEHCSNSIHGDDLQDDMLFTLNMKEEDEDLDDNDELPLWYTEENDDMIESSDPLCTRTRSWSSYDQSSERSESCLPPPPPPSSSRSSISLSRTDAILQLSDVDLPGGCWVQHEGGTGAGTGENISVPQVSLSSYTDMEESGNFVESRALMVDDGAYIQVFCVGKNGWRPGTILFQISDGRHAVAFVDGDIEHLDLEQEAWRYISCLSQSH